MLAKWLRRHWREIIKRVAIGLGASYLGAALLADEADTAPTREIRKIKVPELTAETFIAENRAALPAARDPRIRVPAKPVATVSPKDNQPISASAPVASVLPRHPANAETAENLAVETASAPPFVNIPAKIAVAVGEIAEIDVIAKDLGNSQLTYRWRQISGAPVMHKVLENQHLSLIAPRDGVYIFECVVSNGKFDSEPALCAVTAVADEF